MLFLLPCYLFNRVILFCQYQITGFLVIIHFQNLSCFHLTWVDFNHRIGSQVMNNVWFLGQVAMSSDVYMCCYIVVEQDKHCEMCLSVLIVLRRVGHVLCEVSISDRVGFITHAEYMWFKECVSNVAFVFVLQYFVDPDLV